MIEAKRPNINKLIGQATARIQAWVSRNLDQNAADLARLFLNSREMLVNRIRSIYESFLSDDPSYIRARVTTAGRQLGLAIDRTVDDLAEQIGNQAVDKVQRMLAFQPRLVNRHLGRYVGLDFPDLPLTTQTVMGELTTSVVGGGTFYDRLFNIGEEMKSNLAKQVRQGLLNGEEFEDVRERLIKTFGVDKLDEPSGPAYGSVKIYKNEARRQWNLLMKQTARQAGGKRVWWVEDFSDRLTPGCAARHGYTLEELDGEQPPRHYNCRCTIAIFPENADLSAEKDEALAWLRAHGYGSRRRASLDEAVVPERQPGWHWGRHTMQPLRFVDQEEEDDDTKYLAIPWRDLPKVRKTRFTLKWGKRLTREHDRPDMVAIRKIGQHIDVKTWDGWQSLRRKTEGRWIEVASGFALDSPTVQAVWDEHVQRLPMELWGYWPALRTLTFPMASERGAYAMKVVDRKTAERISMDAIDPAETLPETNDSFWELSRKVLSRHTVPDPYLTFWIIEPPDVMLRLIVQMSTGVVTYSDTPFPSGVKAVYDRVAVVAQEPNGAIWAVIPRGMDRWVLPGGHIEDGETVYRAAVREMREETGIVIMPLRVLGTLYRPWSNTIVVQGRVLGEPLETKTPDEINAAMAIDFRDLSDDERLWLERHGIQRSLTGLSEADDETKVNADAGRG